MRRILWGPSLCLPFGRQLLPEMINVICMLPVKLQIKSKPLTEYNFIPEFAWIAFAH